MSDETTLLPCPFCGGEADEYEGDYGNGVYCMECGAMVGEPIHLEYRTTEWLGIDEAIAAWNARAERTCSIEDSYYDELWDDTFTRLSCGHDVWYDAPKFCPECGARVIE